MAATSKRFLSLLLILVLVFTSAAADDESEIGDIPQLNLKPAASGSGKTGEVWMIPVEQGKNSAKFKWNSVGEDVVYTISVSGGELSQDTTSATSVTVKGLTIGECYSLSVQAVGVEANEHITFMLYEKVDDTTPTPAPSTTPTPGRPSGGGRRPSGGTSGGTSSGNVTPGRALTSGHEKGDKDMTAYDSLKLTISGKEMKSLVVGGTELNVTLNEGKYAFKAALNKKKTVLTLTPVKKGTAWQVPGLALKKLCASGIKTLALVLNGETLTISTSVPLKGTVYTALRQEGWPEATYQWIVDSKGLHAQVNGARYLYESDSATLKEEV